jgi:hypothetical protein
VEGEKKYFLKNSRRMTRKCWGITKYTKNPLPASK